LPSIALADGGDSIWDMFARNRVLKSTDTSGNTEAAKAVIATDEPILSMDTAYYLQNAIALYEPFVAAGGWNTVPQEAFKLVLGNSRDAVVDLKRRLMASGDLPPGSSTNDMFDAPLDKALRLFQARHGLIVTGQVDEATFNALNVPAATRLNQLRINLQRVQEITPTLTSDRYVVVNIPGASIEAVEGGAVAQRHTAVVGRIDRPTPILNSKIVQINFNPYWHVPKSIIRKDLIGYMNKDPQYLSKFHIHIYDAKGNEVQPDAIDWSTDDAVNYEFRQDPGAENSMGHVKINFPNPYDVYLHDTPEKGLFSQDSRFYSSGCMRVNNVDTLVAWLLGPNGGWDQSTVDAAFATNERLDVPVNKQAPIHTTYITAWANKFGAVSFRDDVYNYDAQNNLAMAT
jgi:murein L,D-transpeptidase YcbB/YkuD